MKPRWLGAAGVRRALPVAAAIDALADVLRAAERGDAAAPERTVTRVSTAPADPAGPDCTFLVMPATWSDRAAAAAKVISFLPDNPARGRPTVQGVAVLLDAATGAPRLMADAATLTTIRTGALAGLATRHLARPDSRVVGIVGTGALARDLLAGVAAVRPIEKVVAHNRTRRRAAALLAELPWEGEVVDSAARVAESADVLITATTSLEPVIPAAAVRPGTHINAMGNFSPEGRELEAATVATAGRWVDDRANALAEAGELILAAREGHIPEGGDGLTGDLAGLVTGTVPARRDADQITLFKSVGTALADVAALVAAADAAEAREIGTTLP